MKKRWIVVMAVGVIFVLVFAFVRMIERPVMVSAITLEPCRVEQTISCMGVVEPADTTVIMLPVNCAFSQVNVKAGDRVKKGDVLAVVDKDATRQLNLDGSSLMLLAAMPEEITAPQNGIIMEVKANEHQILENTTPCMVMAADEDLQIRIAIREKDLRLLQNGMQARVTGDGFAKDSYDGQLIQISSTAQKNEGGTVVEGLISFAKSSFDSSLRLGLTAKAVIVTSVTERGYIVPYEAVKTDVNGSYVYVLKDGVATKQSIRVVAQVAQGMLLGDDSLAHVQIVRDAERIQREGQRVLIGENGV